MVEPSIILVAQGEKQLWVGGEGYPYDTSRFWSPHWICRPTRRCSRRARSNRAWAWTFKLDLRMLAELIAQSDLPPTRERSAAKGVGIGSVTAAMLAPFERLLALLDEPEAIPVLAP